MKGQEFLGFMRKRKKNDLKKERKNLKSSIRKEEMMLMLMKGMIGHQRLLVETIL